MHVAYLLCIIAEQRRVLVNKEHQSGGNMYTNRRSAVGPSVSGEQIHAFLPYSMCRRGRRGSAQLPISYCCIFIPAPRRCSRVSSMGTGGGGGVMRLSASYHQLRRLFLRCCSHTHEGLLLLLIKPKAKSFIFVASPRLPPTPRAQGMMIRMIPVDLSQGSSLGPFGEII